MVTGDYRDFFKSTGHIVASLVLNAAGEQNVQFADMRYLCGAQGDQNTTIIPGVSRATLQRFIRRAGTQKTIESQVSQQVGENGLFGVLGATEKTGTHTFRFTPAARSLPFVVAFAHALHSMTDGQFALIEERK